VVVVEGGGIVNRVCVVVGFFWFWLSLLVWAPGLWAEGTLVVINEVLYDPAGSDGGYEFVELFNPGGESIVLEGWTFETGNGNYEGSWKLEWTGSQTDTIRPRGFFVIGEEGVLPGPNIVTALDLQNGPDGCRLTDPAGLTDVVGWGNLAFGEYFEGEPAADAQSGWSIGRDPDGSDAGSNRTDFACFAGPTPADYNHPPRDLTPLALGLSRYTPVTLPEIDLVCRVTNAGTEACGNGAVLAARVGGCSDSTLISEDINPAETARVVLRLPNPGAGHSEAIGWLKYGDDRWTGNDTVLTSIVIPPPPLVINEIMFKPDGCDCEWIEVLNRSAGPLNLKGWALEDSRASPKIIADCDLTVGNGEFLVLVEDEEIFQAIHPDVSQAVFCRPSGGWSTLNDVDGPLGFADAAVIRDPHGTMVDSVAYAESWTDPGKSVERIDPGAPSPYAANWSPHFGEMSSSPGVENSVSFHLPTVGKVLSLSSKIFSPNGDGEDDLVAVSVTLPGAGLVRLSVFDVNGRLVRRLIDGEKVDSGRVTFWDGSCDDGAWAATGVYLLMFESQVYTSGETLRARSPLILVRR
jgi:hypothetical protein